MKTTASVLITDPETYYLKEDIKLILTQKLPEDLLRMFRIGKALDDKKTQFIFLYGILYLLNNDKQKAVENYIKEQIPDMLIIQGYNIDETIITNLRNRIAHPKRDSNIQELEELVNQYVPTLMTLIEKKLM